jgi:hypothetical protein
VRRIAGECTYVDERGAVGIRLEPAAAIDENQDGTRGSNLLCSSGESRANRHFAIRRRRFTKRDGEARAGRLSQDWTRAAGRGKDR